MNPKRPKVGPIHQPTLFQMEKLKEEAELAGELKIERAYSLPRILLGTSAFTADGWQGSFYPAGMKPADYLKFYSTKFQTVEVDSTFYGTPSAATVEKWYEKTPPDFIFAAKVPQVITHDKVLVDCDSEFEEFVKTMGILGPKLGPMVFQFPVFDRWKFPKQDSFLAVLAPFLKKLPTDHKFVIEIRNKTWLDARFADVLRENNVALALTDTSFVPRPWEMKEKFDLVTAVIVDANGVLAGAALFYWSKPIAARINAWSVKPYQRFPKLKMLPGSRNAGTELNYRTMFIWFRLCGAFLFVDASYYLSHVISRGFGDDFCPVPANRSGSRGATKWRYNCPARSFSKKG